MDIRAMVGQRLVVGFEGLTLPPAFCETVKAHKIANVILFAHNVHSKEQLKELCGQIQDLVVRETGDIAFITIDQEGGAVSRLTDDCAVAPGAMAVAATGDARNAYLAGSVTGRELHALGVNFDLAPVFDVNSNPDNPVIGVRAYGDTPEKAAPYAVQMMKGLQDAGVLACAKHFPGHGDTAVDSHLGLPRVEKSLQALWQTELPAFKAGIDAGIAGVMSTHILFPSLEPGGVPATMSRRIMTGLLREEMGFEGLILSDCMMMGAIKDHYGTVNGMLAAFHAGVDLIFSSHSIDYAVQAAEKMAEAVRRGDMPQAELERSVQRILRFKRGLSPAGADEFACVGCAEHRGQMRRLYELSLTRVGAPLPALGENPLFVSCRPFVATMVSNPPIGDLNFAHELQKTFGGTAALMSADPDEKEVAAIAAQADGHSAVVLGTYNGHIKRGQMAAAQALARAGLPMAVVALRNPYDLRLLPEGVCGLAAYAYNTASIAAVARALRGEIIPKGTLPVRIA